MDGAVAQLGCGPVVFSCKKQIVACKCTSPGPKTCGLIGLLPIVHVSVYVAIVEGNVALPLCTFSKIK